MLTTGSAKHSGVIRVPQEKQTERFSDRFFLRRRSQHTHLPYPHRVQVQVRVSRSRKYFHGLVSGESRHLFITSLTSSLPRRAELPEGIKANVAPRTRGKSADGEGARTQWRLEEDESSKKERFGGQSGLVEICIVGSFSVSGSAE